MNYRIIYCSRNSIGGGRLEVDAEIQSILQTARRRNQEAGVTGALIFNGHSFAQVLEGAREAVESIYAAICLDRRHRDVTTLETAYQPVRHFSDWAMAYCDSDCLQLLGETKVDLDAMLADPHGFASRLLHLLRDTVNTLRP